jgi:hypothetical protein
METSSRSEAKTESDPVMDLFPDDDNDERGWFTFTMSNSSARFAFKVKPDSSSLSSLNLALLYAHAGIFASEIPARLVIGCFLI